ncbi:hypothetical protein COCMIDRAFT_26122 [Bipolaris oryzae ATCC 44560]|uniref:Serine-threonine protein kinase 19 n=1 Tax=Bipolaris oryzae ATCC 44560 TaxID=930090 RepID=W6Z714_COCMI|nr:uncharacterized protein COCMIDRAFT_26122 [Bipolaris oryzae ATCC 44560]EUC45765.1 hypothetical protein COCMIDRAFT_26122 [Bipolaris oryzae ATCC 44560]
MSLHATPAYSSRITKPRRKSGLAALGLKRKTSSPSAETPRQLSLPSEPSTYNDAQPHSLLTDANLCDIPQTITSIHTHTFSPLPTSPSLSSTLTSRILNHRRLLPPFISLAHLHAVSASATSADREISALANSGVLRRIVVPDRGVSVKEGVVLVEEWKRRVVENSDIPEFLKEKYITSLTSSPTSTPDFTPRDRKILLSTGFLVCNATAQSTPYTLSLPNMGLYIKLVSDAQTHLLKLLRQNAHGTMPLCDVAERWNGGVVDEGHVRAERNKVRGEFQGVLPGRTKRWKQFYGMRVEWVVEECVGAGLVEVFETGSVGKGVRVVG